MAVVEIQSQGTSSAPFQVNGSENAQPLTQIFEGSGGNANFYLNNSDGDRIVQLTAGGNVTYINNNQNVGIGTTSPTALLDVRGSFKAATVTFTKLPDASTAPSGADLEAVVIDKSTGILYMQ